MTVLDRVDDGIALLQAGRLEGALLSACVAVAGAARIAKPDLRDRDAFIQFLQERHMLAIKSVEYRRKLWSIEEIFYYWMRCEIVHTATLPVDIGWMKPVEPGAFGLRAGGAPDNKLLITPAWVDHFLGVAQQWALEQEVSDSTMK